jgi:diamine N-acetyltransferase
MTLLENDTIRLRALEPEDLDMLYKWENDSTLWGEGNTIAPYSRSVLKEFISQSHLGIYEQKQLRLMIELRDTRQQAGMIDLYDFDPHNRKAGVGILLDFAYRRKGIATASLNLLTGYAFSFLKLHQLFAYISVNNEFSKALFSRCGFTVSGTLHDWTSTGGGGYSDVLVMQYVANKPAGSYL